VTERIYKRAFVGYSCKYKVFNAWIWNTQSSLG